MKGHVVVYLWMDYAGFVCPRLIFSAGDFLIFTSMSMNYNFSINSGSEPRLYNHTGDIIHAFIHGGRGIRIRTDAMLGYVATFVRVRILRPS